MGKPELCLHKRSEDGSRCVLNVHGDDKPHAYTTRLDWRSQVEALQRENQTLKQALWDVWTTLGQDTDGDTGPGAIIAGMGLDGFIEAVKRDAAQWRKESEDDYDEVATQVEAAAKLHRKMHSCGIAWYTMDPTYKGEVATLGPCPTLQALGVTK